MKFTEVLVQKLFFCVKRNLEFSDSFALIFGVRQGSVLSSVLFAIYVDDLRASRSLTLRSFINLII